MATHVNIPYRDPRELLLETEQAMGRIPSADLFNDPARQKLKEGWCAAMFGIEYTKHVGSCKVAVNEHRWREDVDFFLGAGGCDWGFQLAEVQRPERRRGQEYRQLADGTIRSTPNEPGRGREEGPDWLASAVAKKISKHYASSRDLNLLLYANFDAEGLEYAQITARLAQYCTNFASLWVITSLNFCSVFSGPQLGAVSGWAAIRKISEYYLDGTASE